VRRGGPARPGPVRALVPAALVLLAALTSCTPGNAPSPASGPAPSSPTVSASAPALSPSGSAVRGTPQPRSGPRQVMVIAEENHTYDEVFGQGRAPYLATIARTYATITGMDAGYPPSCPSLPAYLLMTSGSTHGICDDDGPAAHRIAGLSIFGEVEAAGEEWREYAESMPAPCTRTEEGPYLVWHAPPPYYTEAAGRCPFWDLPLGTATSGALHDDVAAGSLPAYAFVTPDACHDMHGAAGCSGDVVAVADQWLATWLPQILAGPDYRAGRLVIVITWDEGSTSSNHIPTLVLAPSARGRRVASRVTHCGLLAMEEQVLRVPLLGCAQSESSLAAALGLAP
jgi:hypothetical protein